jgi:hypothetical protein
MRSLSRTTYRTGRLETVKRRARKFFRNENSVAASPRQKSDFDVPIAVKKVRTDRHTNQAAALRMAFGVEPLEMGRSDGTL